MTGHDDQPQQTAWYQGERLHLRVSRLAAGELADVLGFAATDPSTSPMQRRASLLLPDGRRLEMSIQVTDDGGVYNEHGEWIDDDAQPHADISGDFALHVAARDVIDAAAIPYYDRPTPERAADSDERRIRARLDQQLPAVPGDGARQVLRDNVYRRAITAADATRDKRIADAHRFADRHPHAYDGVAANHEDQAERESPDRDEGGRGWSM
jgi:hypothetical protein